MKYLIALLFAAGLPSAVAYLHLKPSIQKPNTNSIHQFHKNHWIYQSDHHRLYLDPDAILEDDDELLQQLRRQMENNFNASPREITNRIKDFFYNGRKSPHSIEAFRSYLETNAGAMDVVNVILLLEGCGRNHLNFRELIKWSTILDAMERPSGLLTSSMLYRGINCIRAINIHEPPAQKFLELLYNQYEENGVMLHANDVCPAIYSMQSLPGNIPIVRKFQDFCARSMATVTAEIPAKPMCSAIFGLKKQKPTREIRYLMWEIANRIEESKTYYHSVNICIALNGLQGMECTYPEVRRLLHVLLEKAIDADEQGFDRAGDREISMAMFGLQRMGIHNHQYNGKISYKNHDHMDEKNSVTGVIEDLIAAGGSSAGIKKDKLNLRKFSTNEIIVNTKKGGKNITATISPELRRTLQYIISLLEYFELPFEAKSLGFAMLGLSRLSADLPETRRLLQLLAEKAEDAWGDISGHELSMILHGFMNLQSDDPSVRTLIWHIIPIIEKCEYISAADARSGIFGLQGMYSRNSYEITNFFFAVADLLERSNISLSFPGEAANILYGIQGLDISSTAGREMVNVIIKMMKGLPSSAKFTGREMAMGMYGLRNANANSAEALNLMDTLSIHMEQMRGQLSANDIATIMYGLQNFRTFYKPVNNFIGALAGQMKETKGSFNPRGLSMTLNGLQSIDSHSAASRSLIKNLIPILQRTKEYFRGFDDFHQLAVGLYGLNALKTDKKEVKIFIDEISSLIKGHSSLSNDQPKVAKVNKNNKAGYHVGLGLKQPETPTAEKVAMALYGLQGMDPTLPLVNDLLLILAEYCEAMPAVNSRSIGMSFQVFKSSKENSTPTAAQQRILIALAEKMHGWSSRKMSPSRSSSKKMEPPKSSAIMTTIRSVMSGIKNMNIADESVQMALSAFATEMLSPSFDMSKIDSATFELLSKTYLRIPNESKVDEKIRMFAEQPEISAVVAALEVHQTTLKQIPQSRGKKPVYGKRKVQMKNKTHDKVDKPYKKKKSKAQKANTVNQSKSKEE